MILLSKPWKVDAEGERIYAYAPGEVCIDICSGRPEDRARVLALLAQVQDMARALERASRDECEGAADCGWHLGGACRACAARAMLRDAGVSVPDGRGGP